MPVYDRIGRSYARARRTDPRIAAHVLAALEGCATVVNVGAGAGSYEPTDRLVVAVEPSTVMLAQRRAGAAPAVQARAEALPFPDGTFDAALAVLTTHHWSDPAAGLRELQRVSRPVVRAGMSSFALLDPAVVAAALERLTAQVQDGTWEREHADLLAIEALDVGYRLVVAGE